MLKVNAGSVTALLQSLHGVPDSVLKPAIAAALSAGGLVLARECEATMSHTDHSLAALAAGGPGFPSHPYARRHGSIRIHPEKPYIVHKQSGRMMRDAFKHGLAGAGDRYQVWLDNNAVDYAKWVMEGTKIMLGRDSLRQTAADAMVRKLVMRAMLREFGKRFRTQSMVRFTKASLPGALSIGET